jgi:hypothetical protein
MMNLIINLINGIYHLYEKSEYDNNLLQKYSNRPYFSAFGKQSKRLTLIYVK